MIPVLYISSGFFHPGVANRLYLRVVLARSGQFAIQTKASLESISNLELDAARVLVLYIHARKISQAALDGLEAFIENGGGLVAVHSAAASFKREPRYQALLGGKFSGHGPVGRFLVQPTAHGDPITRVHEPFWLRDERYLHETCADIQVRSTSTVGETPEPFAWTRRQGAGRVFYCAGGHTLAGLRHPALQRMLLDGLAWAAGECP
jgi:hypothetical protein